MITRLAIWSYRSIRDLVVPLGQLTLVTGANGVGKTSLYRALRLIADVAQDRLIGSLAAEGGLSSTLWAGPERITTAMRAGTVPIQGGPRHDAIALRLGFAGDAFGYAVDLGLPPPGVPFSRDPQIKVEAMWSSDLLGRGNSFAERRNQMVRLRQGATGEWRAAFTDIAPYDSMVTRCADPEDGMELLTMREAMRSWRFYDNLRTDRDAPARQPGMPTYTPVLASDGADLAAAVATINAVGDSQTLADAIGDAFAGTKLIVALGDRAELQMTQPGLLRPLSAAELSDGTLRYLLLAAALLSPRPPQLMVLNEPEASLHDALVEPLARLLCRAARVCQIIVVSHSGRLVAALEKDPSVRRVALVKTLGQTEMEPPEPVAWNWPSR